MDFNSSNIVWSLCFGLLATLIVVGNLLTIWIFHKQRLHSRTQFLLVSLAVADLLVGLLSIPVYIAINAILYLDQPYLLVWSVFEVTDIFAGIASICTLAAISLERMYAIYWTFRVFIFATTVLWILTLILTSTRLLLYLCIITPESFICTLVLLHSTPPLVMCLAYYVVWKKQKTMMDNQNQVVREIGLAKTLFVISAASLLTWLPFQIVNLLIYFGVIGNLPHFYATVFIIKFLQFSNSLVNVLIYPFRISEYPSSNASLLCEFP